jgi:hypothetical protein
MGLYVCLLKERKSRRIYNRIYTIYKEFTFSVYVYV